VQPRSRVQQPQPQNGAPIIQSGQAFDPEVDGRIEALESRVDKLEELEPVTAAEVAEDRERFFALRIASSLRQGSDLRTAIVDTAKAEIAERLPAGPDVSVIEAETAGNRSLILTIGGVLAALAGIGVSPSIVGKLLSAAKLKREVGRLRDVIEYRREPRSDDLAASHEPFRDQHYERRT